MSKQQFKIEDFAHVNDALVKKVQAVLADKKVRRFSTSGIYAAHNGVFQMKETPQNCETCLITRADKLEKWAEWWAKQAAPAQVDAQTIVSNAGEEGSNPAGAAQETFDLEGGKVMTILADGTAQVDGQHATPDTIYFLADGRSIVTDDASKVVPEATDYAGVVSKYALVIGDTPEGELATLTTTIEDSATRMTANELALVQARHDELTAAKDAAPATEGGDTLPAVADGAARVILQKVDKDTYVADGDPFYGDFTASADDANKGTVLNPETGKAVAPGTYATEDTTKVLSVAIGGKATYKQVSA